MHVKTMAFYAFVCVYVRSMHVHLFSFLFLFLLVFSFCFLFLFIKIANGIGNILNIKNVMKAGPAVTLHCCCFQCHDIVRGVQEEKECKEDWK